ncbi:MAG TPA: biosynthetic peptidoglycan transglycosylase [Jatrophihabitans sp.]|nr:biosynthetic peptidoglycan transglycosylase [Jatrophihabitans sp.]
MRFRRRYTSGTRPRRHPWLRRALIAAGVLISLVAIGATVLFAVTPSVSDAQARVRALAARDGAARTGAPVPHVFAESIVASEDSRFYSEPGIDPVGLARAAWATVTGSGLDAGGSTLSQQLAKQLYTDGHGGAIADLEQVALAVKLNMQFSKAQILQMYASTVYFGSGFYGLFDASCGYFGVPPDGMSLAQASLLAGLVQAPSAYDPMTHLALAKSRQKYVLARLVETRQITQAKAQALATAPLRLGRKPSATCRSTAGTRSRL